MLVDAMAQAERQAQAGSGAGVRRTESLVRCTWQTWLGVAKVDLGRCSGTTTHVAIGFSERPTLVK